MSRNIQVIDGALNCVYDIFEISDSDFELLFPDEGQDIEFAEDAVERLGELEAGKLWPRLWEKRVVKSEVVGIHGTLFFGLLHKKKYYPTKRDSEASNPKGIVD